MAERKSNTTDSEATEYVRLSPDTALVCWRRYDGRLEWSWAWSRLGYGVRGRYATREACEAALAQAMKPQERAA